MKQVLLYKSKHDYTLWDASTPQDKKLALKSLFEQLDEFGCYDGLTGKQYLLYIRAKKGNDQAIRELLESRKHCEYEWWAIYPVE